MATDTEVQSVAPDDAVDPQKLKRLGKYVIQKRIGAGGMGTVFLAVDSELQRTVALKVLPRERASNPKLVRRFKSEGQSAARLEHKNIVKIYEAGEIDRYLYIALEYVDGIDVDDLIQQRTYLPVKRSIDIIKQVALALEHAHAKGIVHRDIKPSNLMIRKDGLVKLADLGLARAIDETADTSITQPGMTVGTVDYMSPEQGRNSKLADIRSDIYSLGCTWYHMLTGTPPFPEGSVTSKMAAHAGQPPPNPCTINKNVPEGVVAVIHRMMAKDPRDRYQTPQELLEDLKPSLLSRQSIETDVLAGLAEAESDWEQPVQPDANRQAGAETSTKAESQKTTPSKARRKAKQKPTGKPESGKQSRPQKKSPQADESKRRELPPRSENPEKLAVSHKPLDLDRLKVLVIIFIGVCVVGSVVWAVSRWNAVNDFGDGGTLNPNQTDVGPPPEEPPVVSNPRDMARSDGPPDSTADPDDADNPPTTRIDEYQNVELFAGAERVEDVPPWLTEARSGFSDMQTRLVVSLDENVAADHRSIAEALDRLPASGGVIELVGRGPFPLPSFTIDNLANVAIRARERHRPVVVPDSVTGGDWITFHGAGLEFSGVHLFAAEHHLAGAPAIHVASGTLLMRNSSLTVAGSSGNPATAIQLGDRDSAGANVLLENSVLRGPQLTAVRISSTAVNVVTGNSVLVSGDASAIAVLPEEFPAPAEADIRERVSVSLFATAVTSRNGVFELALEDPERTPDVTLRSRRTVFAAESPQAIWMRIAGWPANEIDDLSTSRARGLTWTGEQFALLGWSHLVEFRPAQDTEPLSVEDFDSWRRFWNTSTESHSFLPGEFGPLPVATDRAPAEDVAEALESSLVRADADRAALGLDSSSLPVPPESLIDRLRAEGERLRLPAGFAVTAGRTVPFDLSNGARLNDFLNSADCPDGATVELTGKGRLIRPIVLRNKSVRLVFPAGEDAATLRPIQTPGGERPAAFIDVEGGSIDLVNAQLTIPSSARAGYPERVLRVIDGSLTLNGCIFIGQFREGALDVPAIEWMRQTGEEQQFASIRNSLIAGRFQAVSADLSNRLLECENCVLTSLGDAFHLTVGSPGYLSLTHCTLSANQTALRVLADSNAPLNCFVEQCVFVDPPETTGSAGVVLTHSSESPGSIAWWGSHNGFATSYRRFHQSVAGGTTGDQNLQRDWERFWGDDHVWSPLAGPKAVLLDAQLPEPDRVEPADYALSGRSEAHTWGPGGQPIGARVDEIGPVAQGASEASPSTPGPRRPTQNDPGF